MARRGWRLGLGADNASGEPGRARPGWAEPGGRRGVIVAGSAARGGAPSQHCCLGLHFNDFVPADARCAAATSSTMRSLWGRDLFKKKTLTQTGRAGGYHWERKGEGER